MTQPTRTQLLQWASRAETLHMKAASLFEQIEAVVGMDDTKILPLAGDTMCSADELRHSLEGIADQ